MVSFFDGIEEKDFHKIQNAVTNDFILYEDGLVWSIDSAFMNIKKHIPFTVKYKISNAKVNVDQMSGDITYFNHADFIFMNSKKQSVDWIESATFRKTEHGWKMNFLHVTERE